MRRLWTYREPQVWTDMATQNPFEVYSESKINACNKNLTPWMSIFAIKTQGVVHGDDYEKDVEGIGGDVGVSILFVDRLVCHDTR
jgi:hypothetical protein